LPAAEFAALTTEQKFNTSIIFTHKFPLRKLAVIDELLQTKIDKNELYLIM